MDFDKTVDEWAAELGEQMRALRLRANLDQVSMAERAGIGLTAIKNLESGKGATLHAFEYKKRCLAPFSCFFQLTEGKARHA